MKHTIRCLVLVVVLVSVVLFSLIPFVHSENIVIAHAARFSSTSAETPSIQPSTTIFRPFRHISVAATGFSPQDEVGIYVDYIDGYHLLGYLTCNNQGNCSGEIYTGEFTAGSHMLIGYGTSSGLTAQTAVTMIAGINASPSEGGQGTSIQITGASFALNETVNVYWGEPKTGLFEGTVTTDSYEGMFSLTFIPPAGIPSGNYPISVQRKHQKPDVVVAWFTLKAPHMRVLTPGIHSGQALSVEVSGFQASEQVTLSWSANGGQTLATFSTDPTGYGGTSLVPPPALPGTYTLTAVGMSSGFQAIGTIAVGPGIELSSPEDGVGQTITVTGGGFSANEMIDVYLQRRSLGVVSATSDAGGNFTVLLNLPDTFSQKQSYHVYAVSVSNNERAQAPFMFQIPAAGLLDQYTFYGTSNIVYGGAFAPGETIKLFWDYQQPGQLLLAKVTADSTGSFTLPITVPSDPNLTNVTLTSFGETSKIRSSYPVYEGANLVPQPASGPDGSRVHVSGGGFDAGETVTVSFLGQTVAKAIADRTGAYHISFILPMATGPGPFNISAVGSTSLIQISTPFVIIPAVTITPDTGPSNTVIAVTGNSFRATETVSIWWYDPNKNVSYLLKKVTSTKQGTFKTYVQAESNLISGDTYYIQATDEQGNFSYYGQATFIAQ